MDVQADIYDEQEVEHWRKPTQSQSSLMDPGKCLTETRTSSAHKIRTSFHWETEGTAHRQAQHPQCNQQLPFPVQTHTNTEILGQGGGQEAHTKLWSTLGNPA